MRSKTDGSQLNLAHGGTRNKNRKNKEEKLKNKNRQVYAYKKRSGQSRVRGVSRMKVEKSLWWEGFVKQIGFNFKPGVKELWSYG